MKCKRCGSEVTYYVCDCGCEYSIFDFLKDKRDKIVRKQERVEELRAMAESMTAHTQGDRVQTSPKDRLSELVTKIIDLEEELDGMIDDYADYKQRVKDIIFSMDNEDYEEILYMHYIERKSLGKIATEKGATLNKIRSKNNRALKKVRKIVDETKTL